MMSTLKCFERAEICTRMALAATDEWNRRTLLETAILWHRLGKQSEQTPCRYQERPRASVSTGFAALITEALTREGIDVTWGLPAQPPLAIGPLYRDGQAGSVGYGG